MTTRRQEKLGRQIQRVISEGIIHLSDPRIEGLISITHVDVAADLRVADVYISVLAKDAATERRTMAAISHARNRIQGWVADAIRSRFCPVLRLHPDVQFKKMIQTLNIIEQLASKRGPDEDVSKAPSDEGQ
ncbi:MAG: 30S ribosome-binding factor RbfA [Sedimentisphaerales bacterium]|jgi:ribosome-binding factor A|nr:30S ribosome-binding factor RbfA [Sedimentisphaerales bacterium]